MRISRLKVENFRAIVNTELSLDKLTALIGVNGAGKTSFLLALERFFSDKSGRIKKEDFNDVGESIIITIKFEGVGEQEECVMSCRWECKTTIDEDTGEPKTTVPAPKYKCTSNPKIDCKAFLEKYVNVIYVPAEHETDDDGEDKKNSPLEKIIDKTVRSIVKNDREEKEERTLYQQQFKTDLSHVETLLNNKLCGKDGIGYAPNSEVKLKFKDPDVTLETDLKIYDSVNKHDIEHRNVGHGTKRAFYMAALEVRADILIESEGKEKDKKNEEKEKKDKNALTLIIIDEPELHQHPQRQKLLLQALQNLSDTPGTPHQVVYTTHSSLLVTLKTPMAIRKVIKYDKGVKVREGANLKKASIRGRILKAMEEAIFANGIILVEGYTDEVTINTIFRKIKYNKKSIMDALVKKEVTVVACEGKGSIKHFYHVFESLNIKQFVLWDGDLNKKDEKLEESMKRNEWIVDRIGREQEFLEKLTSSEDDYVEGPNCVCFGTTGTAYWAKYFGVKNEKLKEIIPEGEDIEKKFDSAKFNESEFYKTAIRIHDYFAS